MLPVPAPCLGDAPEETPETVISTELAQAEIEAQTAEVLVAVLGWGRGTLRVEALDPSESDNTVFIDQSVETMLVRLALLRDGFDHAACGIDCDGAIAIRGAIPASASPVGAAEMPRQRVGV